MKKKSQVVNNQGFTLIELVVVMAIIAVLAAAGLSSFTTSQIKGRDGRRKADLVAVSRALEMYYNDHGEYPTGNNGVMVSCGTGTSCSSNCTWADELTFCDDSRGTVYMQKLPKDPVNARQYYYRSDSASYQLYSRLENKEVIQTYASTNCGGGTLCNYGISSSNTQP